MNVQLAQEVKRRVLAEPALVNMNNFICSGSDPNVCGTAGCIAGHALMAVGMTRKIIHGYDISTEKTAAALLGISSAEANHLFYFMNAIGHVNEEGQDEYDYPYLNLSRRLKKQRPGSARYAKIVADAIDFCIERHNRRVQFHD